MVNGMPYTVERSCKGLTFDGPFQDVERKLGMNVGYDARDPLDHASFVIPATTPMAAVHAGEVHDPGLWMPIRRSIATVIDDGTTFTVSDAEPFHVGDILHSIDVTGPVTAVGVAVGAIEQINYATNLITVTATAGMGANDWVEVVENGAAEPVVERRWIVPKLVGLLRDPIDLRVTVDDFTGTMTTGEVVTEGAIREVDINFPALATVDLILVPELSLWNPASGGVQIVTRAHDAVTVVVPDMR